MKVEIKEGRIISPIKKAKVTGVFDLNLNLPTPGEIDYNQIEG